MSNRAQKGLLRDLETMKYFTAIHLLALRQTDNATSLIVALGTTLHG
jgi:hypothetical protein